MTLITVWLAPDYWDDHFLFYKLLQHINSLRDILRILSTLLGPLSEGPAHFCLISEERTCNFVHFLFSKCSKLLYSSQDIWYVLRGEPVTPLRVHIEIKRKVNIVQNLILNNFCSIILCHFEILEVKDFRIWSLKSLLM